MCKDSILIHSLGLTAGGHLVLDGTQGLPTGGLQRDGMTRLHVCHVVPQPQVKAEAPTTLQPSKVQ